MFSGSCETNREIDGSCSRGFLFERFLLGQMERKNEEEKKTRRKNRKNLKTFTKP